MKTHLDKNAEEKSKAAPENFSKELQHEKSAHTFVDERSDVVVQRRLQDEAAISSQIEKYKHFQDLANDFTTGTKEASDDKSASQSDSDRTIQRKEIEGGLPTELRLGIESLSGYAMDDVRVHYNSDKPTPLNADAYAQGTDIHLAQGQEKHLPHEAWHVVQQKQGRVTADIQMKGDINVNNDEALEKEADKMGAMALGQKQKPTQLKKRIANTTKTVQKVGKKDKKGIENQAKHRVKRGGKIGLGIGIAGVGATVLVNFWNPLGWGLLATGIIGGIVGGVASAYKAGYTNSYIQPDGKGGWNTNTTGELIDAYIDDLVDKSTYLQEGEGKFLANKYRVFAEVFNQTTKDTVTLVTQYGENTNQQRGQILFVGGNHYIHIIEQAPESQSFHFSATDGLRKFKRGKKTVADGNCLIDGLYMIANNGQSAPENDITEARLALKGYGADNRDEVSTKLDSLIIEFMGGNTPQGIGPKVLKMLKSDEQLMQVVGGAREENIKKEKQRKKEEQEKNKKQYTGMDTKIDSKSDFKGQEKPNDDGLESDKKEIITVEKQKTHVKKNQKLNEHEISKQQKEEAATKERQSVIAVAIYKNLDNIKKEKYSFGGYDNNTAYLDTIAYYNDNEAKLNLDWDDTTMVAYYLASIYKRNRTDDSGRRVNISWAKVSKDEASIKSYKQLEDRLSDPRNYNSATGQPNFNNAHIDDTKTAQWKLQADVAERGKGSEDRLHINVQVTNDTFEVEIVKLSLKTH